MLTLSLQIKEKAILITYKRYI